MNTHQNVSELDRSSCCFDSKRPLSCSPSQPCKIGGDRSVSWSENAYETADAEEDHMTYGPDHVVVPGEVEPT
jgi:hypothetical protein